MWQRIPWPASSSRSSGSVVSQISPILRGQRVWNGHPLGGSAALGISPSRRIRRRSRSSSVGNRRQQRLGVGVVRAVEDLVGRPDLHDLAEVEHDDPVRQIADDAEVVADEQVRDLLAALQVGQQVEDRRLNRDVERRGRLVADDDSRVAGERPGDRDALLEAARELDRLHREVALGQAHVGDQPSQPRLAARRRCSRRASRARARAAA